MSDRANEAQRLANRLRGNCSCVTCACRPAADLLESQAQEIEMLKSGTRPISHLVRNSVKLHDENAALRADLARYKRAVEAVRALLKDSWLEDGNGVGAPYEAVCADELRNAIRRALEEQPK